MLYAICIFCATRCMAIWPDISQSISALLLPLLEPIAILLLGPVGIALMLNVFSRDLGNRILRWEGQLLGRGIAFVATWTFRLLYRAIAALLTLVFQTIPSAVFGGVRDGLVRAGRSRWFSSFIAGLATVATVIAII